MSLWSGLRRGRARRPTSRARAALSVRSRRMNALRTAVRAKVKRSRFIQSRRARARDLSNIYALFAPAKKAPARASFFKKPSLSAYTKKKFNVPSRLDRIVGKFRRPYGPQNMSKSLRPFWR